MHGSCIYQHRTVVVDSHEAAPIFREVLSFFENVLRLPVSAEMRDLPVLCVDAPSLNEQRKGGREHGNHTTEGLFHTRGLTLYEIETRTQIEYGGIGFNPFQGNYSILPTQVMYAWVGMYGS